MATPQGARHRDLEQRFKDVEQKVRELVAASLRNRQLSVSEGDFVVSGGGNIVVKDQGQVRIEYPDAVGAPDAAILLGDLYVSATGAYYGTGELVQGPDGLEMFSAVSTPTGGGFVRAGLQTKPLDSWWVHAQNCYLRAETGSVNIYGESGVVIDAPGDQMQLNLNGASTYIGHTTTSSAANARLESNGLLSRVTSSLRYKDAVQDADVDPAAVLSIKGRTWVDKGEADNPDAPRHVGFIAEELDAAGLGMFVDYDDEGRPDALAYDRMTVALLAVAQAQQARLDEQAQQIAALAERIDRLEGVVT